MLSRRAIRFASLICRLPEFDVILSRQLPGFAQTVASLRTPAVGLDSRSVHPGLELIWLIT